MFTAFQQVGVEVCGDGLHAYVTENCCWLASGPALATRPLVCIPPPTLTFTITTLSFFHFLDDNWTIAVFT